jgi:hypothetical protein
MSLDESFLEDFERDGEVVDSATGLLRSFPFVCY